jgi:hypothetical protein
MTLALGQTQNVDTFIANLALAHVGSGAFIQNLATDQSAEGTVLNFFYYTTRDEVLRAFPWPFATKFAQLALVATFPTSEWSYAYRYPSDCLAVRRICSGNRNDNRDTRVPYKFSQDSQGMLILTDWQNAIQSTNNPPTPALVPDIEYTFQAYNTAFWPSDFIQALSWKLGFYVAPQLTRGGDSGQYQQVCDQQFQAHIQGAQAKAANEEQVDKLPESEMIRGRDGWFYPPYWAPENYMNEPGGYGVL